MRTVKNLNAPKEVGVNFPDGTILNQTETAEGTPVVREVLGDPITNMYAILRKAGITPNEQEDNETNGYQLLEAIQKLPNALNDIEQTVTLSGTQWAINLALENLPNKYVFIGRASEDYSMSVNYTFKGTGDAVYNFESSNDFKQGDNILVIIDSAKVRAVGLGGAESENQDLLLTLGNPVSFNDSQTIYYESNGALITDNPSSQNLQQVIQVAESNSEIEVLNIFVLKNTAVCFCYLADVQTYKFFQFPLSNLSVPAEVAITGITIPTGENNTPYVFTDGERFYITNNAGTSNADNEIATLVFDEQSQTMGYSSTVTLASNFQKTTNTVVSQGSIITFVSGALNQYNINTQAQTNLGVYSGNNGVLFVYNNLVYFKSGNVAKVWNL